MQCDAQFLFGPVLGGQVGWKRQPGGRASCTELAVYGLISTRVRSSEEAVRRRVAMSSPGSRNAGVRASCGAGIGPGTPQ